MKIQAKLEDGYMKMQIVGVDEKDYYIEMRSGRSDPFFSCLQSFPASGSFPMSQFFTSSGQSIGASASVLPVNIHD